MTAKQFLKNALKTSNAPKMTGEGIITFTEGFKLNKLWARKAVLPHGNYKSFRQLINR